MALWLRLGCTAAVTLAAAAVIWWVLDAAGAQQGDAIAVAVGAGSVIAGLGGIWASRAGFPDGDGGAEVVSRLPASPDGRGDETPAMQTVAEEHLFVESVAEALDGRYAIPGLRSFLARSVTSPAGRGIWMNCEPS